MDGIRVPREEAEAAGMPDDLDSGILGAYRFPSPARRRTAARIYAAAAGLAALGALAGLSSGFWAVSLGLLAMAFIHTQAAWPLRIDQEEAFLWAAAAAPFPVGHASAALVFVGFRSRPVWAVVLYSAEDPPRRRALVRLEAATGTPLGETYIEELPPPD